jgi:type IV secretory pathway TrbL component
MALSMDEQRMLDEMERKLADDDPLLASRLSSFGHPGLAALLRSPRARLVAVAAALIVIAGISLMVYALGPFRMAADRHAPARSTAPHGVTRQVTPAGRSSASAAPGSRP